MSRPPPTDADAARRLAPPGPSASDPGERTPPTNPPGGPPVPRRPTVVGTAPPPRSPPPAVVGPSPGNFLQGTRERDEDDSVVVSPLAVPVTAPPPTPPAAPPTWMGSPPLGETPPPPPRASAIPPMRLADGTPLAPWGNDGTVDSIGGQGMALPIATDNASGGRPRADTYQDLRPLAPLPALDPKDPPGAASNAIPLGAWPLGDGETPPPPPPTHGIPISPVGGMKAPVGGPSDGAGGMSVGRPEGGFVPPSVAMPTGGPGGGGFHPPVGLRPRRSATPAGGAMGGGGYSPGYGGAYAAGGATPGMAVGRPAVAPPSPALRDPTLRPAKASGWVMWIMLFALCLFSEVVGRVLATGSLDLQATWGAGDDELLRTTGLRRDKPAPLTARSESASPGIPPRTSPPIAAPSATTDDDTDALVRRTLQAHPLPWATLQPPDPLPPGSAPVDTAALFVQLGVLLLLGFVVGRELGLSTPQEPGLGWVGVVTVGAGGLALAAALNLFDVTPPPETLIRLTNRLVLWVLVIDLLGYGFLLSMILRLRQKNELPAVWAHTLLWTLVPLSLAIIGVGGLEQAVLRAILVPVPNDPVVAGAVRLAGEIPPLAWLAGVGFGLRLVQAVGYATFRDMGVVVGLHWIAMAAFIHILTT